MNKKSKHIVVGVSVGIIATLIAEGILTIRIALKSLKTL